jgi:transposase
MRRLDMLKAREILRLKHELGLSLKEIGAAANCGKTTVFEMLRRASDAKITWPTDLNDKQLMSLLYPPDEGANKVLEPDMAQVFCEMKKKGVTLMLLWEEYKEKSPDGVMYTQFCDRYRNFKQINKVSMHKEHKGGEEVEVDWAGTTMGFTDRITGELKKAYIFVAVLPASNYPFVYAYQDMKIPSWIDAHVRAYEYFGGVPKITIPDNTKTAVVKADRFDPILNKSYAEMAAFYGTTILPARAIKPKDKAAGENMVGNVTRRIIASLRNRQFFSLNEINKAIALELEKFIHRPFQKMEGSRLTLFEAVDKPCLRLLPKDRYEYAQWKEANVQFNYHVDFDGFFYSVHYSYVNSPCSVRATINTIEIYIGGKRVALHPRNYNRFGRYKTLPEHMPDNHKVVSKWNTQRFLSWAEKTGPDTREFIRLLLESRKFPVQAYRSCMGILRLNETYSNEIMEEASREAVGKNIISYKYFDIILKQVAARHRIQNQIEKIVQNDNIRGIGAFVKGGLNVS